MGYVEMTPMTVGALIQELQRLRRVDLAVHIPCPHCCCQGGTDFDMQDAEYVEQMEYDGRQVVELGDPRQQCLGDRRSNSWRRVRTAVGGRVSELAAALKLQYMRTLTRENLEQMYRDMEGGHLARSKFHPLYRTNLVIEAMKGLDTDYVMVATPVRATPHDIALVLRNVDLMTELTGRT